MPHVHKRCWCWNPALCLYNIHWLLIKAIFNSQALDPDWFSSPHPPFFFSRLWGSKLNYKLFITDSLYSLVQQSPRWSVQFRFFQALSGLSVAPLTLVFVFHCSRQMSENHLLRDLCSSTSKPPSTPTPKPCSACGWKHLEAKCTKSSCAHAWAKTRICSGIRLASCRTALPPLCFLNKPRLLGNACFPGLLSSQDLERVGSPGFWNKIKRSLL